MLVESLLHGFSVALAPENLLAAFVGVLVGTLVGILPGLGPTGTMALLLPLTFTMSPTAALIMLAGILYGSQYGGSTTAILLNVPGEATSVPAAMEGYPLSRRGRGGGALAVAALGSFFAGTVGIAGLMIFGPPLAQAALAFGSQEYFAVTVLGFAILFQLGTKSVLKTVTMAMIGLALSTVGVDTLTGTSRFTFDYTPLLDGVELVPVLMGLFGLAEVLKVVSRRAEPLPSIRIRLRELYPTREELRRSIGPIIRGTPLGFAFGLLPGPSGVISTFMSYAMEKRISKHPEQFGHGAIEGVAGPEAANNSVTSAMLVPLLILGIPFAAPAAILLSGLMIHGITPGPLLLQREPDLFWGLIASMYVGNVVLVILNLPLAPIFASLLRIRMGLLMPIVAGVILVGTFSIKGSLLHVWITVIFGVAGFLLARFGFEPAPLVLGLVLGSRLEEDLRRSLILLDGDWIGFWMRPLTAVMLTLAICIMVLPLLIALVRKKRAHQAPLAGITGIVGSNST